MAVIERFSTSGLRPRQRVDFWNDLCSAVAPAIAQPVDVNTFEPSCAKISIDGMALGEFNSSASTVDHTSEHVARTRSPLFFLCLQVDGTSVHRQCGREAHLRRGDVTLLSALEPYQLIFEKANKMLVLGITEDKLQREIPTPQAVVAIRMAYQDNLVRLLSDFASGVWRECEDSGLDGVGPSLSSAMVRLIGCAYARVSGGSSRGSRSLENRRHQVLGYIENNLRDCNLSPVTIAARFKSSPRSLHMLFSDGPETLSRYILRRRLEESARSLGSPLQSIRTISDVAFDHGFSSSAHFCKVFRNHFGVTPTEYRRQHSLLLRRGSDATSSGRIATYVSASELCAGDEH